MKKQAFNPYLPLDTCIPAGEPHVFGGRVYIYGRHDAVYFLFICAGRGKGRQACRISL